VVEPSHTAAQTGDPNRVYRTIAGRSVLFDGEGFIWDPSDWTEALAEVLAKESGLEVMGELHWRVLRFLREFYSNYGRAPLNKQLKEGTGLSLRELETLFPGGIKNGARRLAGLPNPKTCV